MKKRWFWLLGVLVCLSCQSERLEKELILKVRDTTVPCAGAHGPMECLQVQRGDQLGTQSWEYFYSSIEGFTFEPGYLYTLKVRTKKLKNPPADASDTVYTLLKVVSKEKV